MTSGATTAQPAAEGALAAVNASVHEVSIGVTLFFAVLLVAMGDRIEEYRRLIDDHRIDLLVLNTLDGDQLAMHGQAYPLAVELRNIPLLML